MSSVIVLASGGVDSAALILDASSRHENVWPLYVRCGFIWEEAELTFLKRFLKLVRDPCIHRLTTDEAATLNGGGPNAYAWHWGITGEGTPGADSPAGDVAIPLRNVILLTHAADLAARHKVPVIEIGVLAGNPFPDATPAFFDRTSKNLSKMHGFPIAVKAPFLEKSKEEVAAIVGARLLPHTFSCLRPNGLEPCGRCNKCAEKKKISA